MIIRGLSPSLAVDGGEGGGGVRSERVLVKREGRWGAREEGERGEERMSSRASSVRKKNLGNAYRGRYESTCIYSVYCTHNQ